MIEIKLTFAVSLIARKETSAVVHIFTILLSKLVIYYPLIVLAILITVALKAIKAVPNEYRYHYQHCNNHAELPSNDVERSAFFKVRSLSILFKLRKVPRAELKAMCVAMKINYLDLVCDMPVQWNSTDKMVKAVL